MLIERIWAGNEGRNYHYLVACPESGEALAIDPLNAAAVLQRARERSWRIRQVFNTHEHGDHTGGNAEVVAATGAEVLAHARAAQRIGGVSRPMQGGDTVQVGTTVRLTCLDTPGHTLAHLCLHAAGGDGEPPALFSGDTLFNAGVGNCHSGDPRRLYESFATVIAPLADATRVFPGHDYLARNLGFTLDREPGNEAARALARQCAPLSGADMPVLTLGEERGINAFLRLDSAEIVSGLRREGLLGGAAATAAADPREVFLALRDRRNRW